VTVAARRSSWLRPHGLAALVCLASATLAMAPVRASTTEPAATTAPATALAVASAATATPSPADEGTVMVFVAEQGGQFDLFAWDPFSTKAVRRLTSTPFDEITPSLSPDGSLVVHGDTSGRLWVRPLDGSPARPLLAAEDDGLGLQPAVGPDNRSVLYVRRRDRSRDDTNLALVDLNRQGTAHVGADSPLRRGPKWSRVPGTKPASSQLSMIASQFFPAWDRDGKRAVYGHLHSRWATKVVSEIWIARIDASWSRQLTLTDALCVEPSWSPDGREIAFSCDRDGSFDIYVVDVETRELTKVVDGDSADTDPVFSPDGKHLAFVSRRSGSEQLWLLERSTGELTMLKPFGDSTPTCRGLDWR